MKKYNHDSYGSGGKETLGETECQMPKQNTRKNLNLRAGPQDYPTSDTGRGYTGGEYFGPGMGKDNMKIRR